MITGTRQRRSWSESDKARIVAASEEPEANISEVARRNGVSRGLLTVWRRQARLKREEQASDTAFAEVRIDDGAVASISDEAPCRFACSGAKAKEARVLPPPVGTVRVNWPCSSAARSRIYPRISARSRLMSVGFAAAVFQGCSCLDGAP
jgi:transposase-like protein